MPAKICKAKRPSFCSLEATTLFIHKTVDVSH